MENPDNVIQPVLISPLCVLLAIAHDRAHPAVSFPLSFLVKLPGKTIREHTLASRMPECVVFIIERHRACMDACITRYTWSRYSNLT